MFGLGKKAMPLATVVTDVAAQLAAARQGIDKIAGEGGVAAHKQYEVEAGTFMYILGWLAIQTSDLRESDKHKLSAELTGLWSGRLGLVSLNRLRALAHLQERLNAYRIALNSPDPREWSAKIVFRFLAYVDAASFNHANVHGGLCAVVPSYVHAMGSFLSGISRTYKFV